MLSKGFLGNVRGKEVIGENDRKNSSQIEFDRMN